MLPLTLGLAGRRWRLLCLGAHPDDIEIGCGGSVRRLLAAYPDAEVRWVVMSATPPRRAEAEASVRTWLGGKPRASLSLVIHDFRDGFFPAQFAPIKEAIEALKEPAPDLILTHYHGDLHQDHRLVAELTLQTFRNHLVWEYEIPKYDGDVGNPNLYVPLAAQNCLDKAAHIIENFPSQRQRAWFTAETFTALMRLRGIGCGAAEGYAEAFYCRKAVV